MKPISRLADLRQLPRESVQAYLDDLAMLSARHGIVIDSGSLMPRHAGVGGYVLTTGGHLRIYALDDREAEVVRADLGDAFEQRSPRTMTADIAGGAAHDLVRRSRQS